MFDALLFYIVFYCLSGICCICEKTLTNFLTKNTVVFYCALLL